MNEEASDTDVTEPPSASAGGGSGDVGPVDEELTVGDDLSPAFNTASDPDTVRAQLAKWLLWLFAVTAVLGTVLIGFLDEPAASRVGDWLTRLLPAELGVLGSAVGFYFGSKR